MRLLSCSILILAACHTPPKPGPVEGNGYRGYIVDIETVDKRNLDCHTLWTPRGIDVEIAEAELAAFLAREAPEMAAKLDQYVRQYVGVVRDGKRRIYINAMHRDFLKEDPDIKLSDGMVWVMDGGDWFFQAEYDMEGRNIEEYGVNGVA